MYYVLHDKNNSSRNLTLFNKLAGIGLCIIRFFVKIFVISVFVVSTKITLIMAVNIQLNACDLKFDENCVVHSMPCKINHDGQANVTGFFSPYIENKELSGSNEVKQASFRGYPLQGKEILIPEGFKGIVVTEMRKPLTDIEERNLVVSKKFGEITYWNWDCFPVNNDSIHQCMDWLMLSKMIHEIE